jgi:spore maturation protein CgeB
MDLIKIFETYRSVIKNSAAGGSTEVYFSISEILRNKRITSRASQTEIMREDNHSSCSKQLYDNGHVELIVCMSHSDTPFRHLIGPPELCPWN